MLAVALIDAKEQTKKGAAFAAPSITSNRLLVN